jgi:membrane associated rhomboid family serine protease
MHGRALLGQLGFLLLINATIPFIFRNISWQAHLGGIIAGFVLGELWSRIKGPDADRLRTAAALAVGVLATISVMI